MFWNSSRKKTRLAHVETQTLQASISIKQGKSYRMNKRCIMPTGERELTYLSPMIGVVLHTLHLDWWRADSDAANRWSTGSQTTLWGSRFIQAKKWTAYLAKQIKFYLNAFEWKVESSFTSIDCRCLPALSKQDLTDGSMFEPPKAATSPSSRGIWTQSCRRTPSFGASTNRLGSAINRNKSRNDDKMRDDNSWKNEIKNQ